MTAMELQEYILTLAASIFFYFQQLLRKQLTVFFFFSRIPQNSIIWCCISKAKVQIFIRNGTHMHSFFFVNANI